MWDQSSGSPDRAKQCTELTALDLCPITSAPYRPGVKPRSFEKLEVVKMLCTKVIDPGHSEKASTIVCSRKKYDLIRLCIDYRKLNAGTRKEDYPITRMDDCLDCLGESHCFPTLGPNYGYWQIEIDKQDKYKQTVKLHHRLERFLRWIFGMNNAPGTSENAMDIVMSTVQRKFALVYMDNVFVFS